jgi:hypothetical protein
VQRLFAAAPVAGVALATLLATAKAAGPPLEPALDASAFVDSVGVNVHFSYDDGPYAKRESIATLVRTLGIRHLRDGLTAGREDICRTDRALAASGVRFTFITQAHPSSQRLVAWASCVGDALEAYEGINEFDISHRASEADWVATLRSSQRELYAEVKSAPALARLTVIGPSLTSTAAARAVGDLAASLDEGNTHDYFAGHEPGTGGWGLGGFGSIAFNLATARLISGDKPVVATETGYATPPSPNSVDDATQAAYVPRLFLVQYAAGIRRTLEYELVDEGGAPFGTYGLVRHDLTPKPAFRALAALLHELGTGGTESGAPSPGSIAGSMGGHDAVSLSGSAAGSDGLPAPGAVAAANERSPFPIEVVSANADVRHMLFARADGAYVLVVWRETAAWDPKAQRPIDVPEVAVTVRASDSHYRARVVALDAAGNLVAEPPARRAGQFTLEAGARVSFVEFVPVRKA